MDPSSLHLVYEAHTLVARAGGSTNTTSGDPNRPPVYKAVGLTLAVTSGLLIGSSFVLKKTGLLRANAKYNEEAGEGYGYLKNAYWWAGMTLMIIGEVCNFVAYAFVDAILVTPLGALSVVVTTILSAIFLKERLSFVGKVGCFNCIIGSVVIVLNAPEQSAVADIQQMQHFVISPGFLSYAGVLIVGCAFIALWVAPRYGKKSMLVYLSICSLIGGLSVVATQGLGSAIVAQAGGKPQFNQWFLYVLLVFVIATLLTEIIYLNKALNLFNAALVTPTYYVFFTSATIVTSAVLFRGFKGTPISITTVIMGFLVICSGVVLLQLSKSAKDVPDAAVFKGDLDQVREITEQEQPETEPKADAIRGTAALIRRLSTSRAKMEQADFKRLHEEKMQDHLEPLRENEVVEWDGLRRRKTIIGDSSTPNSPIVRRKTVHPPLGMSHFPEETESEDRDRSQTHPGFFETIRHRASSILPTRSPHPNDREQVQSPMHPVALTDIEVHPSKMDSPGLPYGSGGIDQGEEHVYGLPIGLRKSSRGQKPIPSPRSKPLPDRPEPSPSLAPQHSARRQFSFTNFLHRSSRTATPVDGADDPPLPPSRSGLGSRGSAFGSEQKKALKNATEEERMGLVKGDSHRALLDSSPDRSHRPLQTIPSHPRSQSQTSESEVEDDGEYYDGHYSSTSRSRPQAPSNGHYDTYNSASSRKKPSSDHGDGWQMTTSPDQPTSQQQPPQQRPSSRKRPSPPQNYPIPVPSQFTIPSMSNVIERRQVGADPYRGPGSHSRTPSDQQREVVRPAQQVRMVSNHSLTSSTNPPNTKHMSIGDQEQASGSGMPRSRGRRTTNEEQEERDRYGSQMRREQSPEQMMISNDDEQDEEEDDFRGNSGEDNSKKRFEAQSQKEREKRRKRMSSGWTNQNVRGGSNGGAGTGGGGNGPSTATTATGGFI